MDEKTLTAVSTSLALMEIQVNALSLLLECHTPGVLIKEDFSAAHQRSVQTVGLETMEGIKNRIYVGHLLCSQHFLGSNSYVRTIPIA